VYIEALYAARTSYATSMALTALTVFIMGAIVAALGRERRGVVFGFVDSGSNDRTELRPGRGG
ncbi:MAG TPA: hypothetical protein VL403_01040, partial [Candidatus Kryptonia bacterium]|nr:hypothetical protein [Candidatus Kryptonia bacterium]